MRTHYAGHDQIYQRHKASGQVGWGTAEDVAENIAALAGSLQADHLPQHGKMLEVGCGAGDLTLWLAARGYDAHGVDIAPTAIAWAQDRARERGLQAEFQVGDVTTLANYDADTFDFVLDGYCLHCIIGPDRAAFLSSVFCVLRPGGTFLVQTMCDDPVSNACRQNYDPATRCQVYGDIVTRYYGRAGDIQAEVEAVGFQTLALRVERPCDGQGQDLLFMDARKPDVYR